MSASRISEISCRANVNHKFTTDSEVVIYEDHRTIINVLFHLKEALKITEPLDMIMFDDHDDFCHIPDALKNKLENFQKNPNKEELNQIVEFDLKHLDDDWVTAGMELDLIGNVFLFNSDQSSIHFRGEYQTKHYGTKYMYNMGDVWSALGHRGILNDAIHAEYKPLWDDFGWVLEDGKFSHKPKRKFIFDIDLDCFSTRILDKTIAIPEEILSPLITNASSKSYHYYYNAQFFMKEMIKKSELTTICFENGCCGGIRQAYKIFNLIDKLLFDYEIGE